MRYYVYILECSDNSYYTGITNNLERRINEHNEGNDQNSYTFFRRPVELVFYEVFNNPEQAILFEKKLKGWSRTKKEALMNKDWDKLKILSGCKNETSSKYYTK